VQLKVSEEKEEETQKKKLGTAIKHTYKGDLEKLITEKGITKRQILTEDEIWKNTETKQLED